MTASEKTRLLPKDYQKSYVIPIPQEDMNNNTSALSPCSFDSYALTKAELASYINDPFWIRLRCICFSLYWLLCIVALFISCYIAVSALETGVCTVEPLSNVSSAAMTDNSSASTTAASPVTTLIAADGSTDSSSGVIFRLFAQPS